MTVYLATALLAAQLAMDASAAAPAAAPSVAPAVAPAVTPAVAPAVTPAVTPIAARASDPAVIRTAVKAVLAGSSDQPSPRETTALSGDAHTGFTRAVDEARVPGCLNTDALKHQPPKAGAISFDGLMAVPFWLSAMVRGKCN
jgi:hypothetical protein